MASPHITRRSLLGSAGLLATMVLSGCLEVDPGKRLWSWLTIAENLNRWLLGGEPDAGTRVKTYPAAAISPMFRINSLNLPDDYEDGADEDWESYRLTIDGLVDRPQKLGFDELMAFERIEQTTRLDCVEGWSAIAKWTGLKFADLLDRVGVNPRARYVVCHAADSDDAGTTFYGSLSLEAARHPQTLLAYGFNDTLPLPIEHGAPLRLLLPTQLGYKSTKYIQRITLVEEFASLKGGKGGYWEDQGYEWYAGI